MEPDQESLSGIVASPAGRHQLYRWMALGAIMAPVAVIFIAGPREISVIRLVGSSIGGAILCFAIWLRRQISNHNLAARRAEQERDGLLRDKPDAASTNESE